MAGALDNLIAAVVISVMLVPLSLYYDAEVVGGLWILVFAGAVTTWCICMGYAIFMAFVEIPVARLFKALFVFSVAMLLLCLLGMWLLADYGSFGIQMRGILQYNLTSSDLLALHANGAAGIFKFEHGPSAEHASDSTFWGPHPFTGTHQIDVPCHLDVVGADAAASWNVPPSSCPWCEKKSLNSRSASSCPGYVRFVLMPFWLSKTDQMPETKPTAFVFQCRVSIFSPWERDVRNRVQHKCGEQHIHDQHSHDHEHRQWDHHD